MAQTRRSQRLLETQAKSSQKKTKSITSDPAQEQSHKNPRIPDPLPRRQPLRPSVEQTSLPTTRVRTATNRSIRQTSPDQLTIPNPHAPRDISPSPSSSSSSSSSPSISKLPDLKRKRRRGRKFYKRRINVTNVFAGSESKFLQIGFVHKYKKVTNSDSGSELEILGDHIIEVIGIGPANVDKTIPKPPLPDNFLIAARAFTHVESGKVPHVLPPEGEDCPEIEFYCFYIGNALRNLLNIGQKLSLHWWVHELREGWYDASVWCYFIDALFCKSEVITLLRKEIGIIPRGHLDRFDGVFRYSTGVKRFDLGVVEVGPPSTYPNSDPKPEEDRAKILFALTSLVEEYRKVTAEPIQVVGILCSGWTITISHMWSHGNNFRVQDRKFAIWTDQRNLFRNLEVIEALVEASEIMLQSAVLLNK